MSPDIPNDLRVARRELFTVPGFKLLDDLKWDPSLKKWVLHFELHIDVSSEYVPVDTRWYAIIGASYPRGDISIFPDKTGGITETFRHQRINNIHRDLSWRRGAICVHTTTNAWGRKELTHQPAEPETKLWWHVQRAVDWLYAAATDTLAVDGEPFELPDVAHEDDNLVVFNEDGDTFKKWSVLIGHAGTFNFKTVPGATRIFAVKGFDAANTRIDYSWGKNISTSTSAEGDGIWILLNKIPIVKPWRMPTTWCELYELFQDQGLKVKEILQGVAQKFKKRDFKLAAIGFPVSEYIGSDPCRIHWLFVRLPDIPVAKGFSKDAARISHKANIWFNDGAQIKWAFSENWNKNEICSRGRLCASLEQSSITLIGAGAAGSHVGELFMRLGCEKINVIDADAISAGNLSRHTLLMNDIRHNKAAAVAAKLNSIFPFANVEYKEKTAEQVLAGEEHFVMDSEILVEGTGEDDVMHLLGNAVSGTDKILISLSLGLMANRLYCFVASGKENDDIAASFFTKMQPWLIKDNEENKGMTMPREGIGCWHPIFPARLDDILMLLNTAIKPMEKCVSDRVAAELIVVEKTFDEEKNFTGVRILRQ
jgi:hypothetical protein